MPLTLALGMDEEVPLALLTAKVLLLPERLARARIFSEACSATATINALGLLRQGRQLPVYDKRRLGINYFEIIAGKMEASTTNRLSVP